MASQSYPDNYVELILKRSFLCFIVILFFCDIAIYLSLAVSARLQPQYWIGLLVVLGGVLAWFSPRTRWEVFRTPLFLWCVLFFVLTVIFFFAVPTSHIEQLKERFRDVVLLVTFLGIFLMLPDQLGFGRKLVLLAVILGGGLNLISFSHNGFMRPPGVTWAHRPGGFYINPNESGVALLLGMLIAVEALPRQWRALFAVFVLAGVAVTFSREAVLGWLVAVISLCAFKVIGSKSLGLYLLGFIIVASLGAVMLVKTHVMHESMLDFYRFTARRFTEFFMDDRLGAGNEMRVRVLVLGWSSFLAHPWIGNGIGFTYHWSLPQSTHNMYLMYMDDYGIVGLFLYPLLIGCMVWRATGEIRKITWTMAILLLFWGLFDHNVVQNYYSLFAISLTAAMTRISANESAKQMAPISAEVTSG